MKKIINYLAIIPARKGSKGIKNKNITLIKKQKLIEYTFKSASKSKLLKKIYLTTNDERIIKILPKYKKIKLITRDDKLSTSKSNIKDAIIDAAKRVEKKENAIIKHIVILQPTSPQRTNLDIDNAIKYFERQKSKILFSISKPINHPNELIYFDKDLPIKVILEKKKFHNRQEYKNFYFINGSIFISNLKHYLNNKNLINHKTSFFKMEKKHSIDLDDNFDKSILKNFL
jgi:CMP-N,N'-diacetyllegionaminic acid synthase